MIGSAFAFSNQTFACRRRDPVQLEGIQPSTSAGFLWVALTRSPPASRWCRNLKVTSETRGLGHDHLLPA